MKGQEKHIHVQERAGKLIVEAPQGQLTPEIVAGLREHKAELLEYLSRFGKGVVQVQPGTASDEEPGESWAAWKARALNRLFMEQGATGRPGRITAATVVHGEQQKGPLKPTKPLSYISLPDKPDNPAVTGSVEGTYECQVPEMNPTSPNISTGKPDKISPAGEGGAE